MGWDKGTVKLEGRWEALGDARRHGKREDMGARGRRRGDVARRGAAAAADDDDDDDDYDDDDYDDGDDYYGDFAGWWGPLGPP